MGKSEELEGLALIRDWILPQKEESIAWGKLERLGAQNENEKRERKKWKVWREEKDIWKIVFLFLFFFF